MRSFHLFITKQVDTVYVNAAWIFVVFRALHSVVHCIFNLIILRFYLYLFGTLAVWFIAIQPLSTSVPKKSLWLAVHCPHCQSTDVKKHGVSSMANDAIAASA